MVPIVYAVNDCREPKDNKFPEVAVNSEADAIVTVDEDVLGLTSVDCYLTTSARSRLRGICEPYEKRKW